MESPGYKYRLVIKKHSNNKFQHLLYICINIIRTFVKNVSSCINMGSASINLEYPPKSIL